MWPTMWINMWKITEKPVNLLSATRKQRVEKVIPTQLTTYPQIYQFFSQAFMVRFHKHTSLITDIYYLNR